MVAEQDGQLCGAVESRNLLAKLPTSILERIVDPNADLLGALAVHLSCKALHRLLDTSVWRRAVCAAKPGTQHTSSTEAAQSQEPIGCSWRALYLRQRPLCLRCEELVTSLDVDTADLLSPRQHLIEGVLCHACWQEHPDVRVVWSTGMLAALHEPVPVIWSGWLRLMFLGRHCYHSAAITRRFLQICSMLTQQAAADAHQHAEQQALQPQNQTTTSAHPQPQRPLRSLCLTNGMKRLQVQHAQPPQSALTATQHMPTNEHELQSFLLRLEQGRRVTLQQATPSHQGTSHPHSKGILTTAVALHQALPRLAQYVQTGLDSSMPRAVAAVLARHGALLAALQRHCIGEVPSSNQSRLCAQFLAGMCAMEAAEVAQKVAETRFLHQHTNYGTRQQELHNEVHWPDDEFDDVADAEGGSCYRLTWREAGEAAKAEVLQQCGGAYPQPWPWQQQSPV